MYRALGTKRLYNWAFCLAIKKDLGDTVGSVLDKARFDKSIP